MLGDISHLDVVVEVCGGVLVHCDCYAPTTGKTARAKPLDRQAMFMIHKQEAGATVVPHRAAKPKEADLRSVRHGHGSCHIEMSTLDSSSSRW